jgi:hypothetical protein
MRWPDNRKVLPPKPDNNLPPNTATVPSKSCKTKVGAGLKLGVPIETGQSPEHRKPTI